MQIEKDGQIYEVEDVFAMSGRGPVYIITALPADFTPGKTVLLDGVERRIRGVESRPSETPKPLSLLLALEPDAEKAWALAENLADSLRSIREQHQSAKPLYVDIPPAMFEQLAQHLPDGLIRIEGHTALSWARLNVCLLPDEAAAAEPAIPDLPRRRALIERRMRRNTFHCAMSLPVITSSGVQK